MTFTDAIQFLIFSSMGAFIYGFASAALHDLISYAKESV